MEQRINGFEKGQGALKAMFGITHYLSKSKVEQKLFHLVEFRVSQINGCAYCLDMHSKDLRAEGETEQRLYMLEAWRETPLYTDRERAALAWTEALTLLPETNAPDAIYEQLQAHFTPEEQVKLTMLIGIINAWNRFGAGFRGVHPVAHQEKAAA